MMDNRSKTFWNLLYLSMLALATAWGTLFFGTGFLYGVGLYFGAAIVHAMLIGD